MTDSVTDYVCRRVGQQEGVMNYAQVGQRESHRENFSLSFEVQRAIGRVVCACVLCMFSHHHVDRGWERGSIPRLKKIEKTQKYGHLGDYK